jgi:CRP/FNR family transcriptional regulator, dissimilatory nitrate respiration regulator
MAPTERHGATAPGPGRALIWRNTRGPVLGNSRLMDATTHTAVDSGSSIDRPARGVWRGVPAAVRPANQAVVTGAPDDPCWATLLKATTVTSAQRRSLSALCSTSRVAAGAWLYRSGEPAPALLALGRGAVALGSTCASGSFRTERQVHGPAWLDTGAAWLHQAHRADARALTDLVLLALPRDALGELLDHQPGLARGLIDVLAHEVQALSLSTHELMHKDAPARLAAWLCQHAQAVPEGARLAQVQLTMRKRDIASQLAITPETLSRLMRSLAGQGVLRVAGYTVHVLDLPALQRIAGD